MPDGASTVMQKERRAVKSTSVVKPTPKVRRKTDPKSRRSVDAKITPASYNIEEIRALADLVEERGLTDFEFENKNIRIRISKNPAPQMVQAAPAAVIHRPAPAIGEAPSATNRPETPHPGAKAETEAAADEGLFKIVSPIVGTFYSAPGPDKDPFVQVGSHVNDETVVCIVEAMKLMNEILAETSGEVVKVYVENGQPVEYGQPLFGIRK